MNFSGIIKNLIESNHLSGNVQTYEHGIRLQMNQEVAVDIRPIENQSILIESVVLVLPRKMQEEFYQSLLGANRYLPERLSFSFDPTDRAVFLQEKVSIQGLTFHAFLDLLRNFAQMIPSTKEKVFAWQVEFYFREGHEEEDSSPWRIPV